MAWATEPSPNPASYPSPNPFYVGNALANLVSNYQQGQQGQQATQQNNLRLQQDQQLLDQSKAFAGGVPTNPDGTANYSAIMNTLAEKGDINAISQFAPIIQQQQQINSANAPSPLWGGGGSGAGGGGSTVDQLASGIAKEESGGNYNAEGPVTKSGDRAYGKYQVMGDNIPQWTKEVLGVSMTPEQFLADPDAQEKVAHAKLGEYLKETGDPQDAASMWLTGKPLAQGANLADQNGTTGAKYAAIATQGMGGGGGTQVASDASEAPAYASPDKPAIPPVSAAAGSSIPRENATTAVGAVGGAPQQTQGGPLAANNPAWAGLNASLPVGPNGAPAQAPSAPAPRAPAQSPAGSVASIASAAGIPPQVTANIAKAVGAAPDAPLTPQQAQRAQTIVQNYKQRAQQQQQQTAAGQGQPQQGQPAQGGGPIIPQFQLPPGAKTPQQGILMIDREMARLSSNPYAVGQVKALADWRDHIAQSSAPMEVHPGTSFVDPVTGQTRFQAPQANASNVALSRFLQENPDATAEQVQQFMQAGRGGARSGVGMYMQRYLQENPNASAEDVAKAAQDFQSEGSALTKFTSGPQGNSIRSFNVLVDHLGIMDSAADALKNGNMRAFNQAAQEIARQTGSPAPTDFDATKALVGDEIAKAVIGGGGALGDRDEIKATIDKANSPDQLAGVINKYKKLALGQLRGLDKQYTEATGRDDFDRFLAPGTKAFFGDKDGGQSAPDRAPATAGAPPAGHTEGGYRFKGGDPSKKENWEKVD
jgi:hypothetical protein